MRILGGLLVLGLGLAACSSDPPPVPGAFQVAIPAGQPCSDILEPPVMEDRSHIAPPLRATYTTDPPTSGPHYSGAGVGPFPAGVHGAPVPDETQVHNLEHGHVIVQYQGISDEELKAIRTPVLADPVQMLMVPRPDMRWKLALTAWGAIQVCSSIPDDVEEIVTTFVDERRARAPENIP